jgi:hypothetical protein
MVTGKRGITMAKKVKLPSSVGFAVTQMIEAGLLDDVLHIVGMALRKREKEIKRDRADSSGPR